MTRPTIALIVPNIHHDSQTVWLGALDTAEAEGVNLISFPSGIFARSPANQLYALIDQVRVDALIVSPDNLSIPTESIVPFCEQFRPLPVISQGTIVQGFPSVVPDNYHGMREVITHLIEVHGYRRIAYARGLEGAAWEQDRYRAYVDTLREYGLPIDNELVVPPIPENSPSIGHALQTLLDERRLIPGRDVEALALCAIDLEGRIYQDLHERDLRVPLDLAVTGYDDYTYTRAYSQPMTTVRQPLYAIGQQSVLLALACLRGEVVSDVVKLPAHLIVRRSCGCTSPQMLRAAIPMPPSISKKTLADIINTHQTHIVSEIRSLLGAKSASPGWIDRLLKAFVKTISTLDGIEQAGTGGNNPSQDFLAILEAQIIRTMIAGEDIEVWHDVISILRQTLAPVLDDQLSISADNIWHQARVVISEIAQQEHFYQVLLAEQHAHALRDTAVELLGTLDMDNVMHALAKGLPRLGIPSAYLALFEDPEQRNGWSRLMLDYTETNGAQVKPGGFRFRSQEIIPACLWSQEHRYSLVVESLHFRDEIMGFVCFEVGPHLGNVYDTLRAQISSVIKTESLYEEALLARNAAEKADQLKTRLLANVSHELRTPLNVILGHTQAVLNSSLPTDMDMSVAIFRSIQQIETNAEHQLRMVNDLLDLSRAEINELQLSTALIDPRPFLEEVFGDVANTAGITSAVSWQLQVPARLPAIQADPNRLRQILFNLLSNAARFTEFGKIVLGAEISPPHLHIWVQDTGLGIPVEQQERIFEPFFTLEHRDKRLEGVGLGLSITRRLVALHQGIMTLESRPGLGSTFHIYLPLPVLRESGISESSFRMQPVLLLVSSREKVADEILELSRRQGLEIYNLQPGDDLDVLLADIRPAVLAWDRSHSLVRDGVLIRQLCNHSQLCQIPFIFFGQMPDTGIEDDSVSPMGMTNVLAKPVAGKTLSDVLSALCIGAPDTSVLIVDDDPHARKVYQSVVNTALPGYSVYTAADGYMALTVLNELAEAEKTPGMVILDLGMPEMNGFEVLDWMRTQPQTRHIPVLILSGRILSFDDIRRLDGHTQVTLQSKGILSEEETIATLQRILTDRDKLPLSTSALVKQAIAYFHQEYNHTITRQEMSQALGVNEDYLSEIFRMELGISPWDYLNRYRVMQAKTLLRYTDDSIAKIATAVGYNDPAYFSRVFRKLTGFSPTAYRQRTS